MIAVGVTLGLLARLIVLLAAQVRALSAVIDEMRAELERQNMVHRGSPGILPPITPPAVKFRPRFRFRPPPLFEAFEQAPWREPPKGYG